MRSFIVLLLVCLTTLLVPLACVDPEDLTLRGTVDVIVVDGTITNLTEPQFIRLNRSQADRLTGRFGTSPLTKALVEIVVDSSQVIACLERDAGRYQAPDGFIGQIAHSYQVRFTLSDGMRYQSTAEVMQPVPAIADVHAQFNPTGLLPAQQLEGGYAAAHDLYVDFTDPADQKNYYRWDWIDWERQEWCRSCQNGLYFVKDTKGNLLEDCVGNNSPVPFVLDYNCRTQCWEIIYSRDLALFDDKYSNGNPIIGRKVAQVPLYSKEHCLIEIRQTSLTATAYLYFKKMNDQTQNTGGVADTPASIPVGNVHSVAKQEEPVVGYFTASAVTRQRYWLTRSDATGFTPGLFQALNGGRLPRNEQSPVRDRPPLAVCVPGDSRTPFKPDGWLDK